MRFDDDAASILFAESTIGKIVLDENLSLVKVNKTMLDYLRIKDKEIIGQQFGNYFNCATVSKSDKICDFVFSKPFFMKETAYD